MSLPIFASLLGMYTSYQHPFLWFTDEGGRMDRKELGVALLLSFCVMFRLSSGYRLQRMMWSCKTKKGFLDSLCLVDTVVCEAGRAALHSGVRPWTSVLVGSREKCPSPCWACVLCSGIHVMVLRFKAKITKIPKIVIAEHSTKSPPPLFPSFLPSFLQKYLFLYLKELHRQDGEMEMEDLDMLLHSSDGCHVQDWARNQELLLALPFG